ncbi:MAG: DTW domain-containing protein [Alphaproteobacteria bacterium]|nr:DTW domain-containing protein [Alphaproteobacteria bacterium]
MDSCERCRKPTNVCVCDRCERVPCGVTVLVLQHPQEEDRVLGTVPLLEAVVGADRRVGLSWANLAAARGGPTEGRWAVVWPQQLPEGAPVPEAGQVLHLDRAGKPTDEKLEGIVLLDGSWSQAKALWWRNAWLLKLDRIVLSPKEASIYGRLRREPRPTYVSTLEAAADALVALGEPEETRGALRRAMRTMVQRARDAG